MQEALVATAQEALVITPQEKNLIANTRTIATLLGFLPERHAMQLLQGNIINAPPSVEELHLLWEDSRKRSITPPQHKVFSSRNNKSSLTEIKPLPHHLKNYERELKSCPTYLQWYLGFAEYEVWCVPVCQLITPQWFADLSHIEMLKERTPQPGDWQGALEFAFNEGAELEEPVLNPLNGNAAVVFRALAQNLRAIHPPEIRRISSHEFEVVTRIQTAPNYLQVGRIRGNLVLVNGIHRASALMNAGWEYIPCLVRKAENLIDAGFTPNQLGIIPEPQMLNRPPYLCDFFNPKFVTQFQERLTDQVLRVISQSETLFVPRS